MIDGYVAMGESIHLRFGIEYHQALQDYDIARAEGIDHEDAIHSSISELVRRTHDWSVDETVKPGKYKTARLSFHLWWITLTITWTILPKPTSSPMENLRWN